MNFTYLLLALGILVIPMVLLFVKKTSFNQTIKFAIPAVLITGLAFSIFATVLVMVGVWSFHPAYLTGVSLWKIPVEEFLFSIAISLAGIGVYVTLNAFFPNNALDKFSLSFSNLLMGICVAMLIFTYTKWYSAISFGLLFVLIFYIEYLNKLRFTYKFYRGFLAALVLFYIAYGVISTLPVISYTEVINLKLGAIPFESHFYFMGMLLMSVYLFELFKSRAKA
jgi:lycopene cyclase domain-containing protein